VDSIMSLLEELDILIEQSKPVRGIFGKGESGMVAVNPDEIYEIISRIGDCVPSEIRTAQRIARDEDKIIKSAESRAAAIIEDAEERARILVEENNISKKARKYAKDLIRAAKENATQTQRTALEYADEKIALAEKSIRDTLDSFNKKAREIDDFLNDELEVIYTERKQLRDSLK